MRRSRFALIWTALAMSVVLVAPVSAAVQDGSENISRSYDTNKQLEAGTIVSTAQGNAELVEPSNTSNSSRMVGVVVRPDNSLLAVDPDSLKAQVATSGTANVLVSTVNGTISSGTKIAASPFSGVGMKAVGGGYIIGSALSEFNGSGDGTFSQQVTDKSGNTKTVRIGYVQVTLSPRFDSAGQAENLTGVQQFVRSLTGHKVSMARIIMSLVIAVLTIVAIIVLVYAGIYGSIISIGRNPLARNSIMGALAEVLGMAALAFAVAFLFIFLLLR